MFTRLEGIVRPGGLKCLVEVSVRLNFGHQVFPNLKGNIKSSQVVSRPFRPCLSALPFIRGARLCSLAVADVPSSKCGIAGKVPVNRKTDGVGPSNVVRRIGASS